MNHFNALCGYEPTWTPRECNKNPPEVHFKSWTSPPKTSPVSLAIVGILNHHYVGNGDVEVHPSNYALGYTSESVTYPDTTLIKSIDDDEVDQLLELFHSENDDYILDVDLQMLQA